MSTATTANANVNRRVISTQETACTIPRFVSTLLASDRPNRPQFPQGRLFFGQLLCTLDQFDQVAVDQVVAEFRRRRDIIVAGLNDIPGITCLEPQGAFYAFPNITGTGQTSADLQARLLADAGVAALSGTAFGPWGEGFLRFSYANSVENIRLALDAIRAQPT